MRRLSHICFFLVLSAFGFDGYSQQITAGAKLDKSVILLGDQTTLRLSANVPANAKIEFPLLSDTISTKLQIVEIGKLDTLKEQNGRWVISRAYIITSFEPGVHTVPSFRFTGPEGQASTDPLPLQVREVKVDTTKGVFDIKQPMAVRYTFVDWLRDNWGWVIAGVLFIILLIGLWFYYRRPKPLKHILEPKPAIAPDVAALQQLDALRNKNLWQKDEVKQYYSELADIIRTYLEHRYQIPAMEQTSEQIFASLKNAEVTEQNKARLRDILLLADLVKFAKQKPLPSDNESVIDNAIIFVKESRSVVQPIKMQGDDEIA